MFGHVAKGRSDRLYYYIMTLVTLCGWGPGVLSYKLRYIVGFGLDEVHLDQSEA